MKETKFDGLRTRCQSVMNSILINIKRYVQLWLEDRDREGLGGVVQRKSTPAEVLLRSRHAVKSAGREKCEARGQGGELEGGRHRAEGGYCL